MKIFLGILVIFLVFLHQDYWQWYDISLFWGFMPTTLVYHILLSLSASGIWWLATLYCWPKDLPEDSPAEGKTL